MGNFTLEFKGTLDYIFFSSDSLAVLAVADVDSEQSLAQETALPSSQRPSDHVSLVGTFMFREDPPTAQHPLRNSYVAHHHGLADAQVFVPGAHSYEPYVGAASYGAGAWI